MKGYRGTFPYEKALRKRRVWVEPLFAEAKDWHGMRRFRLRRLQKVNAEALLIAAGQNVKRLLAGKTHYVISMGDAGGAMGIPVVPGDGGHRALAVFSAKAKARAFYSAFVDTPAAYLDMIEDCAAAGVAPLTQLAAGEYGLLPVNLGGVGLLAAAVDADVLLVDPDGDGRALPVAIKVDPLG